MIIRESLIPVYPILFTASFIIGFGLACFELKKNSIDKKAIGFSILINAVMSLYFAMTLTQITSGFKSFGFSSMGGLAGIALGSFIIDKIFKTDFKVLKAYLLQIPLMYSISKLGCFLAGCCYGELYDGPFSVRYIGEAEHLPIHTVFPVQLVETIVFLLIYLLIMFLHKKNVTGHLLMMTALSAFAKGYLDSFRYREVHTFLSVNQVLCIIIFVLSVVLLMIKRSDLEC